MSSDWSPVGPYLKMDVGNLLDLQQPHHRAMHHLHELTSPAVMLDLEPPDGGAPVTGITRKELGHNHCVLKIQAQ